jgi:hypothetical protein
MTPITFLISAAASFGHPPSGDNADNCTKSGCWFSFTNRASIINPTPPNGGRCGEVDAAPRMPNDIWNDQAAVDSYVRATQEFYAIAQDVSLGFGPCNHNPSRWYQNGNKSIDWIDAEILVQVCSRKCNCGSNGIKCPDVRDDPSKHQYCSLCGS